MLRYRGGNQIKEVQVLKQDNMLGCQKTTSLVATLTLVRTSRGRGIFDLLPTHPWCTVPAS